MRRATTRAQHNFAVDLDGTVITCRARQVGLTAHLARIRGRCALDVHAFWLLKRDGATTRGALEHLGWDTTDAAGLAAVWTHEIEATEWLRLDALLDRAPEALMMLRDAGHRIVLLTARRDPGALAQQLNWLGLTAVMDEVVVVRPGAASAEKAEALRRLGALGFVGDTESDARAAEQGGVPFAAVSTGQRSAEYLVRSGVRPVCSDLRSAVRKLLYG